MSFEMRTAAIDALNAAISATNLRALLVTTSHVPSRNYIYVSEIVANEVKTAQVSNYVRVTSGITLTSPIWNTSTFIASKGYDAISFGSLVTGAPTTILGMYLFTFVTDDSDSILKHWVSLKIPRVTDGALVEFQANASAFQQKAAERQ